MWSGHSDDCSLTACTFSDRLDLLHPHPAPLTDLPAYLRQAPASDCSYQKAGEGACPLSVPLVINEPT